jgi:hypothetical protein
MSNHAPRLFPYLALVLLLGMSGCNIRIARLAGVTGIRGNGVIVTEERSIEDFQSVRVSGAIRVEIESNTEPTLTIKGDENLLPLIQTQVVDGCLVIEPTNPYSTSHTIVVNAGCVQVNRYDGSGATEGVISSIDSDSFEADVSGASSLVVGSGHVRRMKIRASGASTFDAPALEAYQADVDSSGASTIIVNAIEELKADASGASSVRFLGTPNKLTKDESGASSIRARD